MTFSFPLSLLHFIPILVSILFRDQPDMCRVIPEAAEFCGTKLDFGILCGRHDSCYANCQRTQRECDTAFGDQILQLCNQKFNHTGPANNRTEACYIRCAKTALIFHVSVRNFAKDHYKDAQRKANCSQQKTTSTKP